MKDSASESFRNFLSKENLAALKIQSIFYKIHKHKLEEKLERKVVVFYSSIASNSIQTSLSQKAFNIFDCLKIPYTQIDLLDNDGAIKFAEKYPGVLPKILINDVFIGSTQELQGLVDKNVFDQIYNELYLKHCLLCYDRRKNLIETSCNNCKNQYLFFAKQKS